MQWLSRNIIIGLKTTYASMACLEAPLEESRRAACRGPLLLRLFAAMLLSVCPATLLLVVVRVILQSDYAWGSPEGAKCNGQLYESN
jgi:hypothetical protein